MAATNNNVAAVAGRNRDNSAKITIKNCVNLATINEGFTVADDVANGEKGTVEGTFNATTAVKGGEITIGDVVYDKYNFGWLNPTTGKLLAIVEAEDGTYMVGSGEALATVFSIMTANTNITLTADVTLPEGTPTVMLDYAGTFDGANFTINGISNTMFKKIVGGTVKNVTLNGDIDYVANTPAIEARKASTLAGDAKNVTLTNVTSNVNVKTAASDLNAGGVLGYANEAHS